MGCSQISPLNTFTAKTVKDWSKLTLREKVAQMIMVRIRGDYYNGEHWYRQSLKKWLSEDGIGGVITFGGSIHGTFYNIQTAINSSNDNDTVLVQPGTYVENINFNGKNIVVGSLTLTTADTSYISFANFPSDHRAVLATFGL